MFPLVVPAARRGKSSTLFTHIPVCTDTQTQTHGVGFAFRLVAAALKGSADDCATICSPWLTSRAIVLSHSYHKSFFLVLDQLASLHVLSTVERRQLRWVI